MVGLLRTRCSIRRTKNGCDSCVYISLLFGENGFSPRTSTRRTRNKKSESEKQAKRTSWKRSYDSNHNAYVYLTNRLRRKGKLLIYRCCCCVSFKGDFPGVEASWACRYCGHASFVKKTKKNGFRTHQQLQNITHRHGISFIPETTRRVLHVKQSKYQRTIPDTGQKGLGLDSRQYEVQR